MLFCVCATLVLLQPCDAAFEMSHKGLLGMWPPIHNAFKLYCQLGVVLKKEKKRKEKLACVEKCSGFRFSHLPISQFVIQLLWKESSTDTREGVKSGADVIYSDPLSVFASIACSCAVMPDGTDLFADAQTELLCVCTPVCTCV